MTERIVRTALSVVIAAAAALLLLNLTWLPYRCNLAERRLETELRDALGRPTVFEQREARRILSEVEPLCDRCPAATNLHMVEGLAHRIVGNYDAAVQAYTEALVWDRRPELYYNLGMTLLSAGRKEEAIPVLTRAAAFDPYMIWRIGDPDVANRVFQAVQQPGDPMN